MDLLTFDIGSTLGVIFLLSLIALPIAAFIDIVISRFADSNTKIIWLLLVVIIPLIGSLAYLFIGTKQKIRS